MIFVLCCAFLVIPTNVYIKQVKPWFKNVLDNSVSLGNKLNRELQAVKKPQTEDNHETLWKHFEFFKQI